MDDHSICFVLLTCLAFTAPTVLAAATCSNDAGHSLGFTDGAVWPKLGPIEAPHINIQDTRALTELEHALRLSTRDKGDCLEAGSKFWEIEFDGLTNVYAIYFQATDGSHLTEVDLQYHTENDTWENDPGHALNFEASNSIVEHLIVQDANEPVKVKKTKKLRIVPTSRVPATARYCTRVDVHQCSDDVMAADKCAVGHKSVGLTKDASDPRLANDKVTSPDMTMYTGERIRLNLENAGACLYGGATHFKIEFEENTPVYKFAFQGSTVSNARKVRLYYKVEGSDARKNENGLENEIDLTVTEFSTEEVTLTAITMMKEVMVEIIEAEPTTAAKCLSMAVFQCPVGTDLSSCSTLQTPVELNHVSLEGATQSVDAQWDEEANLHRFEWRDYSGGCLGATEEIVIKFDGDQTVFGFIVQGASNLGQASGVLTKVQVSTTKIDGVKKDAELVVDLKNPVASQVLILSAAEENVLEVRIMPLEWTNQGTGQGQNAKTCFRFDLLGCPGCGTPLGMDVDDKKIDDNQLSTTAADPSNLQEARLNSATGFCMAATEEFEVDFMTTVSLRRLVFVGTATDNIDDACKFEVYDRATSAWVSIKITTSSPAENTTIRFTVQDGPYDLVEKFRLSSTKKICFRMEFLGCRHDPEKHRCAVAGSHSLGLGYKVQTIPLSWLSEFPLSSAGPLTDALRLENPDTSKYCVKPQNDPHLTIDLQEPTYVQTVQIQGHGKLVEYPKKIWIEYMDRNGDFVPFEKSPGVKDFDLSFNAPDDTIEEIDLGGILTRAVRVLPKEPAYVCMRLDLKGCRMAAIPKVELTMKAPFELVGNHGNMIPNLERCLDKYAELFPNDKLETEIGEVCHALGKAKLEVEVGKWSSEPNRVYFYLTIEIDAWQNNEVCANRVWNLLGETTTADDPLSTAECSPIEKVGQFVRYKETMECSDDTLLVSSGSVGNEYHVCIHEEHVPCAPLSTFAPVPEQVAGYAASFRENMLYGDQIVVKTTAEECQIMASAQNYPSHFFHSDAVQGEENCFLTTVTVNDDYYFVDQSMMTTTAKDEINQRKCYYDYQHLPYYHVTQEIVYNKEFEPCFGDELTKAHLTRIEEGLVDSMRKQMEPAIHQCLYMHGVSLWNSGMSVETHFDTSVPAVGNLTLTLKVTGTMKAITGFADRSALELCQKLFAPTVPDIVVGYDCGGGAQEMMLATDATTADFLTSVTHSCNADPEEPSTGDEWYLGPQDHMCYKKDYEGYEVKNGFCPAPADCEGVVIEESINACARKCLHLDSCYGFNYDVKKKLCTRVTSPCQDLVENKDFLFFKRIDGLCKTLVTTDIQCVSDFAQLIQKSINGDYSAAHQICSLERVEKVEKCYGRILATCEEEQGNLYKWMKEINWAYMKVQCEGLNVHPNYLPVATCDMALVPGLVNPIIDALVKSFISKTEIKDTCDNYAVTVRDVLKVWVTEHHCNDIQGFLIMQQLQFLQHHYLLVCNPIPDNGDRTDEYCSIENFNECNMQISQFLYKGIYADHPVVLDDLCSEIEAVKSCAVQQTETCDTTDRLIGLAYSAMYSYKSDTWCKPELITCSETDNLVAFYKGFHTVALDFLSGHHKDGKMCIEAEWATFRSCIDASISATTTDCTGDMILRIQAKVKAIADYRTQTWCTKEPIAEIKEGEKCHHEDAMKCVVGVTRNFVSGWLSGPDGQFGVCESYFNALTCVHRQTRECSGPTRQRFFDTLNFYWALIDGQTTCHQVTWPACEPMEQKFDLTFNTYSKIVIDRTKTDEQRCSALTELHAKLSDVTFVDISSCGVYSRFERITALRLLEFHITPTCTECGTSVAVRGVMHYFADIFDDAIPINSLCSTDKHTQLEMYVSKLSEECDGESLEHVQALARVTQTHYNTYCDVGMGKSNDVPFCVIPDWTCPTTETSVDADTVMNCRQMCKDSKTPCHAFFYENQKCTIMKNTCTKSEMTGATGGFYYYLDNDYRRCKPVARFCARADVQCPGHVITNLTSTTLPDCQTACRYNQLCKSFEYETAAKTCVLKNDVCSNAALTMAVGFDYEYKLKDYEFCEQYPDNTMGKFCQHSQVECKDHDLSPFSLNQTLHECLSGCVTDTDCVAVQYYQHEDHTFSLERNRCTMKKGVCTEAELVKEKKGQFYLETLANEAVCTPTEYKDWKCDETKADECVSMGVEKLFLYSVTKDAFYTFMMCQSFKETVECIKENAKDCRDYKRELYNRIIDQLYQAYSQICEYKKQPAECHIHEARELLPKMGKQLVGFRADVNNQWDLTGVCGAIKTTSMSLRGYLEHCHDDWADYIHIHGASLYMQHYLEKFCITLRAQVCSESSAYKCMLQFSQDVLTAQFAISPQQLAICTSVETTSLAKCLIEGTIACPNSVQYFRHLIEYQEKSLRQSCSTPACRPVYVADIVFVVDESGSVKEHNYEKQIDFLRTTVNQLEDIEENGIRVAIVEFSSKVNEKFYLEKSKDKDKVMDFIEKMKYKKGSTRTYDALDYVRKKIFKHKRDAPRLVVVLTDGKSKSQSDTIKAAGKLKDTGAKIFVIGIGPNLDEEELKGMASGADFQFSPKDFTELQALGPSLLEKLYCDGVGAENVFLVTDGNDCKATAAQTCVTTWQTELLTVMATATDTADIKAVCLKITETTECLKTAVDQCSGPTKYRMVRALWELREAVHFTCAALVDGPEWGHYDPSCDPKFIGVGKCISNFEEAISRTKKDKYKALCDKRDLTFSCVSDSMAGCPALEGFFWSVRAEFISYPLIGTCDPPVKNPPVTGTLCPASEASIRITAFNKLSFEAAIEGDYEEVCKFEVKYKKTMRADMKQCTVKQNEENSRRYHEILALIDGNCNAVTTPEVEGCSLEKMTKCITDFNAEWISISEQLISGDTDVAAACLVVAATTTCIEEHVTKCDFVTQFVVDKAVRLFRASWSGIVTCETDVYIPPTNENCMITEAQADFDRMQQAAEIGDGSSACVMRATTKKRIEANLIDCPDDKTVLLITAYNKLIDKLEVVCKGNSQCMTDKTRVTLNAGESTDIKFWFEGNPYNKWCAGKDNCEIKVRYSLQTKAKDDHRCERGRKDYIYQAQGVFKLQKAQPGCGIIITPENYGDKHTITINSRWFRKKSKTKKRRLDVYYQVYLNGNFDKEESCRQIEVTFTRDSKREKNLKQCYMYGDPHITTWANVVYNAYTGSDYTLMKYTDRQIQIQGHFSKCNPSWPYACLTKVHIQVGGYVFNFDNEIKENAPKTKCRRKCKNKKKTRAKDFEIKVKRKGDLYPGFRMYYQKKKKVYHISFASGMQMKLEEIRGAFDMTIYPTSAEYGKVVGLCGSLRDDDNDLYLPDGTEFDVKTMNRHKRPRQFIDDWEVAGGDKLEDGKFKEWTRSPDTASDYCSCSMDRTAAHVCADYLITDSCHKYQKDTDDKTETVVQTATKVDENDDQAPLRRKKRAVANPPPDPTWPSPSGVTESEAITVCETARDSYPVLATCAAAPYNVEIKPYVDTCITDIQLNVTEADAAEMNMKKALMACQDVVSSAPDDPNNPDAADNLLQAVDDLLCPNNCNGNGQCVNGTCDCNTGWGNADCSLDLASEPDVIEVGIDGECNPRATNCSKIVVTADNINNNATPTCLLQQMQISSTETTAVGSEYTVEAVIISASQIVCPAHTSAHHEISVSNDGVKYGSTYLYMVFDPTCIVCDATGTIPVCRQNTTSCLVGSTCYADGTILAGDDCLYCNIKYSTSSFDVKKTQECYQKNNRSFKPESLDQTDMIIIGCVAALVLAGIVAFIVFKFFVQTNPKAAAAGSGGSDSHPIHRANPEARYTFDGPDEPV